MFTYLPYRIFGVIPEDFWYYTWLYTIVNCRFYITGCSYYECFVVCSCSVLSKLRSFASSGSSSADYTSLLTTMCKWKKGNEVMELISDWLEPCLASSAAAAQRVSCESANELLSSLALFILLARLHKLWVETVWLKRRVICVRVDSGGHMMKMNIHTRCEAALMMSL